MREGSSRRQPDGISEPRSVRISAVNWSLPALAALDERWSPTAGIAGTREIGARANRYGSSGRPRLAGGEHIRLGETHAFQRTGSATGTAAGRAYQSNASQWLRSKQYACIALTALAPLKAAHVLIEAELDTETQRQAAAQTPAIDWLPAKTEICPMAKQTPKEHFSSEFRVVIAPQSIDDAISRGWPSPKVA